MNEVAEAMSAAIAPASPPIPERKLQFAFAKRHGVLVRQINEDGCADCVCRQDAGPFAIAELRRYLRRNLRLERIPEADFDELLRKTYEAGSEAMQAVEGFDDTQDLAHLAQDLPEQADLLDSDDDAPIIRLINAVLTQAVKENASDIHVEPFENRLVVRFRVDGILLVTGPTGSGKTTTLYAGLERLNDNTQNIMTVEDPIEYFIDGIGQTQVNTKVEMTFARGLRAILRQDPDVVMVGEIRDLETAQIAVQASLTGHLVLSTLHTNTAAGALTRLRDMGIEPFLLSSSLIGVLAQRLVRVLNPESKQPFQAGEYERRLLNLRPEDPSPVLYRPGRDSSGGYRGRSGIYELIVVDDAMRTMIHDGASEQELERHARKATPSIRDDGRARVLRGETTIEEVLRVTRED